MAKFGDYPVITGPALNNADTILVLDVSDTTESANGSVKQLTIGDLIARVNA